MITGKLHISDEANPHYFARQPENMRLMGYNLQTSFVTDSEKKPPRYYWENRAAYVMQLIREINPHIACLVEFSPLQAKGIKTALPTMTLEGYFSQKKETIKETIAKTIQDPLYVKNVGEGIGFLYDPKKIHCLACEVLALPKGANERIAVIASLIILSSNTKCRLIVSHFDHRSTDSRLGACSALIEKINTFPQDEEVIMYADTNFFPDGQGEEHYQAFLDDLQGKMSDPLNHPHAPHLGPNGTFPGHEGGDFLPPIATDERGLPILPQSNRLDVIFLSERLIPVYTHTANALIDYDQEKLVWPNPENAASTAHLVRQRNFPSDHLPVVVEVFVSPSTAGSQDQEV